MSKMDPVERDLLIDEILKEVSAAHRPDTKPSVRPDQPAPMQKASQPADHSGAHGFTRSADRFIKSGTPSHEDEPSCILPKVGREKEAGSAHSEPAGQAVGKTAHRPKHTLTADEVLSTQQKETSSREGLDSAEKFFEKLKRDASAARPEEILYKRASHPSKSDTGAVDPDLSVAASGFSAESSTVALPDLVEPGARKSAGSEKAVPSLGSEKSPTRIAGLSSFTAHNDRQLTGQVSIPGFEAGKESSGNPAWEEDLRNQRNQRIRDFQLDPIPMESDEPEPEPDVFEYNKPQDAEKVRYDLQVRRHRLAVRCVLSAILIVPMLLSAFADQLGIGILSPSASPEGYLIVNLAGLLLVALIHFPAVLSGIRALLHRAPDCDTAIAIAFIAAMVHTGCLWFRMDSFAASGLTSYNAAVAVLFLFSAAGKHISLSRVAKGFSFVESDRRKEAVVPVPPGDVSGIARIDEKGKAAAARPAKFLYRYLYHAYAEDPSSVMGRTLICFLPLFAAAAFIGSFWMGNSAHTVFSAFSALCGVTCIGIPCAAVIAGNLPLRHMSNKMRRDGIFLSGCDAVDDFRKTDLIAIDASDLFPVDTIRLVKVRTSGRQSIDNALLDAAGVLITAGSTLAPVFEKIIQGQYSILPEVDTLVYEEKMGISGWVAGHRVLIGNRKLMDNHSIWLPEMDFESAAPEHSCVVYLATAGLLSAVFTISYEADEYIADALQRAVDRDITVTVSGCDQNLTVEFLCDLFNLPLGSIRLMNSSGRRDFRRLTEESEQSEAVLATEGGAGRMIEALLSVRRLHTILRTSLVIQILCYIVSLAVGFFLLATAGAVGVSVGKILAMQAVTLLFSLGIPWILGL